MVTTLALILLLGKHQHVMGDHVIVGPPVNVQATQDSDVSAPVEISWSPPPSHTSDLTNITGYRIFFDDGENISLPSIVTSVGLLVGDIMVGQQISIRTEAEQESPSELVNITVTRSRSITDLSGSSDKAAAIALGTILALVVLIVMALVAVLLLLLLRLGAQSTLRRTCTFRNHFILKDPNMSENVAYGRVNREPLDSTAEDLQTLVIGTEGSGIKDTQPHPAYENINYSELVD